MEKKNPIGLNIFDSDDFLNDLLVSHPKDFNIFSGKLNIFSGKLKYF